MQETAWVEPFPDEMIDGQPSIYPEAVYEVRESITLAFVAALPVNRYLIARGQGHALVHGHHEHEEQS